MKKAIDLKFECVSKKVSDRLVNISKVFDIELSLQQAKSGIFHPNVTPGSLILNSLNKEISNQFEVGKEYSISITDVEKGDD